MSRVMAVAKVIKDVRAITTFGVTELDHFAQLASFKIGAALDVGRRDAQLCRRNTVEHKDRTRSA